MANTDEISEKYKLIAKRRNTFVWSSVGFLASGGLMLTLPRIYMKRVSSHFFRQYCRGNVLDLTPTLLETSTVELFEASHTVRVQYLITNIIQSEEEYIALVDKCKTDAQRQQCTRDMTLRFLQSNDPWWLESTVTFETVQRSSTPEASFDTVLARDELWRMNLTRANELVAEAARYVRPDDGVVVVMDISSPTNGAIRDVIARVHKFSESDLHFDHDYKKMFTQNGLRVVEHKAIFFGFYSFYALQKLR